MIRRIRRREHELPQLNMASLPDLIFTVLFFFMIVTHMRTVEPKVKYTVPRGTELEKLVKKQAVSYIYIGQPMANLQSKYGSETCIQLNDKIANVSDIENFIKSERKRMSPEDAQRMTVSIKADENTDVGIISDVKLALRRAGAYVINYSSTQKNTKRK
ncbi:MAG: biopolymer transporter ExbD [Prevotella sp.]|nr:biopolymer transporter ExbD [Prevotella sp.]